MFTYIHKENWKALFGSKLLSLSVIIIFTNSMHITEYVKWKLPTEEHNYLNFDLF